MSISKIISTLFNKKEDDEGQKQISLIEQIRLSMNNLVQKTDSLNDSWQEEKASIKAIYEATLTMKPCQEILGSKFEQDILGYITAVSSACDGVIAGKQDVDFKGKLHSLQTSVNQRLVMK